MFFSRSFRAVVAVCGVLANLPITAVALAPDHSVAALSQGRIELAAAVAGTNALFAGGSSSGGFSSDVVDIFESTTGLWTSRHLSVSRFGLAGVSLGNTALFGGGGSLVEGKNQVYSNAVDVFDASGGSSTATLSRGRVYLAATSVGPKAIFAGGECPDIVFGTVNPTNVVDIFDAGTGQWSTATLSYARSKLAAASVGNKAFFAGGYGLVPPGIGAHSDLVDIYDAGSGLWTVARLSEARSNLTAVSAGNKVFFAGGTTGGFRQQDPTTYSNTVDIYDLNLGTWTSAHLSQARTNVAAAVIGDAVLFGGGVYSDSVGTSHLCSVVDVYNISSGTWSTTTLSEARYSLAATSLGNMALFAGGGNATNLSAVVDVYAIPEPATLSLLALGGLTILKRSRKNNT